MKKFIIIMLAFLGGINLNAQDRWKPKFHEDGTFKIAQFTDLHWMDGRTKNEKTLAVLKYVMREEEPDLVVITGDIAHKSPSRLPWDDIANVFDYLRIPFIITMGNHDAEEGTVITKEEIFDRLIVKFPHFEGKKGPKDIPGVGNYVLPIYGQDDKIATLVYCFDSHRYHDFEHGRIVEPIAPEQIEWYRQESEKYTKKNGGKPYPALAFFHIPLPEFADMMKDPHTVGTATQPIDPPTMNTGLFSAFVQMKDVMGVFVGHNHHNDCVGQWQGIALGFGRKTGFNGDGDLVKGARIIELQEGKRTFKTWICTPESKELYFTYPVEESK